MEVARCIKKYGVSRVAKASGYPVSTIHRWFKQDRIPGNGKSKELRQDALASAFAALKASEGSDA